MRCVILATRFEANFENNSKKHMPKPESGTAFTAFLAGNGPRRENLSRKQAFFRRQRVLPRAEDRDLWFVPGDPGLIRSPVRRISRPQGLQGPRRPAWRGKDLRRAHATETPADSPQPRGKTRAMTAESANQKRMSIIVTKGTLDWEIGRAHV